MPRCLAVYETAFHKSVYVTQGFVFSNMVSFESKKLNPSDMSIRALARNLKELQKEPEGTKMNSKAPEGTCRFEF